MAIAIGTIRTVIGDGVASVDILNVTTTGSDTYLLVALGFNNHNSRANPDDITSVVLDPGGGDETALSLIANTKAQTTDDGLTALYGVKPPSVTNKTVRITIATATLSGDDLAGGAWPLTGVDQTTPAEGGGNNNGVSATPASATITSETDDLVFGCMFSEGITDQAVAGATVEDWQVSTLDGFNGAHEAGAASVVLDWTQTNDKWAASACNINQAAGVTRAPPQADLAIDEKTPSTTVPSHIREKGFRFRNPGAIGAP